MGVLEGNIQIWQDLRVRCHYLDQPVGDVARECVHDADPVQFRNSPGDLFEQARQAVLHPQVVAVIGRILSDQDEFTYAQFVQSPGFAQDGFRRAADRAAFDERDGADAHGRRQPSAIFR